LRTRRPLLACIPLRPGGPRRTGRALSAGRALLASDALRAGRSGGPCAPSKHPVSNTVAESATITRSPRMEMLRNDSRGRLEAGAKLRQPAAHFIAGRSSPDEWCVQNFGLTGPYRQVCRWIMSRAGSARGRCRPSQTNASVKEWRDRAPRPDGRRPPDPRDPARRRRYAAATNSASFLRA
jgi:hypothetical protein